MSQNIVKMPGHTHECKVILTIIGMFWFLIPQQIMLLVQLVVMGRSKTNLEKMSVPSIDQIKLDWSQPFFNQIYAVNED